MAKKKINTKVEEDIEEELDVEEENEDEEEYIDEYEEDEITSEDLDDDLDINDLSIEDRIINIEKKANITLFIVLITCLIDVILLFGIFNNGSNNESNQDTTNNTTEEQTNYTYDTSAMKEITAADIASESKKETIVVVIGRQGCSACANYVPIITEVAKEYNITVRYIDLAKIIEFTETGNYVSDKEAFNTLIALTGNDEWKTFVNDNITGTPLTIIIKNNKVIGGVPGYYGAETENTIKDAFDAAGLKK